ncbi:hypothetical protein EDB85DRAFT_1900938 [Lactarius pseudohatsudake]|nr:hypothetical protein EDB85DRAFT_1900938 [Lactarius pseudohatsudake]
MSDIGGSVEYQARVAELRVAGYISGHRRHKRRAAHAAGLQRRRREIAEEREATPLEMSAFLDSRTSSTPLSSIYSRSSFSVRRRQGLPLEAHANPLARSHIAIGMALRDPTIFDSDRLFELNAVLIAQMHPLFVLSVSPPTELFSFLSSRRMMAGLRRRSCLALP